MSSKKDKDWPPLALAVAPNGARKTKADHPALPITPAEIARCGAECLAAGAAMMHLHVRDEADGHSLDAERYKAVIAALRAEVGDRLILQITTEAVGIYRPEEQIAAVQAVKPEAASLALREFLPEGGDESAFAAFLLWLKEHEVLPQFILYDAPDLQRFQDLQARGIIPFEPAPRLYVLGRYAKDQRSSPADLLEFLAVQSGDDPWSLCAFGPHETACAVTAAGLGGHARVGFENNLQLPDGSRAANNAALVASVAAGCAAIGRPLADADQARAIMGGG